MKRYRKVVWKEGMFVTPHHFQQWDRYYEGILNSKLNYYIPLNWGIKEIDIDNDALYNGNITILRLKAILPDSLIISIPDIDQAPESRSIADFFPSSREKLDIFIAVPIERMGISNLQKDINMKDQSNRYIAENIPVLDENRGENEKVILTAKKNIKILFAGEVLDDYIKLKFAEVVHTPGGGFSHNKNYIPPCISISGSDRLMSILRGLIEVLSAKSRSLADQRRHKTYGVVEFGTSDISNFWLLHTINSFIPLLTHYYNLSQIHPEKLYQILIQLTGELTTFSTEGYPMDIPAYNHTELTQTFEIIDKKIRTLTETVIPAKCIQIPLERTKQTIWVGRVENDQLFESARFFISIQSDLSEEEIKDLLPKRIKIGSLNDIDIIVNAAMRGLNISHTPRPPGSIPIKIGRVYFLLDSQGDFWDPICKSKTFAFYIPTDISGIKIELLAVEE